MAHRNGQLTTQQGICDAGVERITLLDSLDGEWLKLPLATMCECGSAAQTLAGIIKLTSRETFVPIADIAHKARLPKRTVEKHLMKLDGLWIERKGRQQTGTGWLRRTATVRLCRRKLEPYGILPWWACGKPRGRQRLPWCARAVLSVVMARLCGLKAAAEQYGEADELEIANIEGLNRWHFSLTKLMKDTGLSSHHSVTRAKQELANAGIVNWEWAADSKRGDLVAPNYNFAAVITPASNDRVFIDFDGGNRR